MILKVLNRILENTNLDAAKEQDFLSDIPNLDLDKTSKVDLDVLLEP